MKESDYILATAVTKVRLATEALRDVDIGTEAEIPEGEHRAVMDYLRRWRLALEDRIAAATPEGP